MILGIFPNYRVLESLGSLHPTWTPKVRIILAFYKFWGHYFYHFWGFTPKP